MQKVILLTENEYNELIESKEELSIILKGLKKAINNSEYELIEYVKTILDIE